MLGFFNSKGKILQKATHAFGLAQKVKLKGVKNVDWEGMTVDSKGNFYIADIGDNKLRRKSYRIHQFTEPEASAKRLKRLIHINSTMRMGNLTIAKFAGFGNDEPTT